MNHKIISNSKRAPVRGVGERTNGRRSWRRVELARNDWNLLRLAHEQRFLTHPQVFRLLGVGNGHFYAGHPIDKRLRKLEHFGFISRVRVHTENRRVVLLGAQGLSALRERRLDHELPLLQRVDPATFLHDKILTDLRFMFGELDLRGEWRSERQLRRAMASKAVADADMRWSRTGQRVALELERSHKRKARYLQIIARHMESTYPWVLYVFENAEQLAWLFRSVIPAVFEHVASPQLVAKKLRFTALAKIENQHAKASVWSIDPYTGAPRHHILGDLP